MRFVVKPIEDGSGRFMVKNTVDGWFLPCTSELSAEHTCELLNGLVDDLTGKPLDLHKDFEDWNAMINKLSTMEHDLISSKETYAQREQEILTTVDFKELYGKNNETIRKNHIKSELSDMVDKKNELELDIADTKRRIDFTKMQIQMKINLIKYTGEKVEL